MNVAALQPQIVIGFVIIVVSRGLFIEEFRNGLIAEEPVVTDQTEKLLLTRKS